MIIICHNYMYMYIWIPNRVQYSHYHTLALHVCKYTMYMDGVCLHRVIYVQLAHHQTSNKSALQVTFTSPSTGYIPIIKYNTNTNTNANANANANTNTHTYIHTYHSVALHCIKSFSYVTLHYITYTHITMLNSVHDGMLLIENPYVVWITHQAGLKKDSHRW